jgi:hypothetical protein
MSQTPGRVIAAVRLGINPPLELRSYLQVPSRVARGVFLAALRWGCSPVRPISVEELCSITGMARPRLLACLQALSLSGLLAPIYRVAARETER